MEPQTTMDRKMAAAVAAVMAYLEIEQASAVPAAEPEPPPMPLRLWGVSGRQAQMANRQLMQLRAFR